MAWRKLALLAPLLMAAAPPPNPCGQAPAAAEQLPAPLDLSGRPEPATPLVSSALVVVPAPGVVEACGDAPPPGDRLQDPRSDALHGLPAPGLMQVMPEPPLR
jgi:hypothetical protein